MLKIHIATGNLHKISEFNKILALNGKSDISLIPLEAKGLNIVEDGKTYQENVKIKLQAFSKYGLFPILADDSGFEITAFDNEPGIRSARYLGEISYEEKFKVILSELEKKSDRSAKFVCCLGLFDGTHYQFFEKSVMGKVSTQPKGKNGFGYDPIFIPENETLTMAELPEDTKNQISHRALALGQLLNIIT